MVASINIALPVIGKEFGMNAILLSWIPTSYLLAAAMFLIPFGKVADIYGQKKIFTIGMIVYTISSFLSAIAFSSTSLIIFRILQGIGAAMIFGTSTAILTSVFPLGEKGKALGINVAAVYTGLSLGPFLGGLLTQQLGWRSIFWLNSILGLLTIILTLAELKGEWNEAKGEKFDIAGSMLYSLSLLLIMYGFTLLPAKTGFILIIIGGIGIFVLLGSEQKIPNPIIDIKLFKDNIPFAFSNLAALINYSATSATGFLLSLYLQYIKGLNPQAAGLVLVSQPIMQTIFSPFAGRLSDKFEPRIIASIGMGLTVIGLIILAFINSGTSLAIIIFDLILLGIGFGLFSSPNVNAVMKSVEKKLYGIAASTVATMRLIGQMLSLGIVMLIFSIIIGRVSIAPVHYPLFIKSARILFAIFGFLCLTGIWASLARGNVHKN